MSDTSTTISRKDGSLQTHQILHSDLSQRIFVLALPTLMQQLLTFCVGLFDLWLSGRIDAGATSAIGVSAYVSWLGGLFVGTVGIGTTALIARHLGAGERVEANRVLHVAIVCGQFCSFAMAAGLYLLAPVFVTAFQMEGNTAVVGLNYLRMDAIGHLLTGTTLVGAAALRGSGDMARPMIVLGAINVLNVLLSFACVYGIGPQGILQTESVWIPAMGVYGIAAGTVAARLTGGILMGLVLLAGSGALKLRPSQLKPDPLIIGRLFSLGIYAAADNLINWAGQFAFLIIIRNVTGMPYSADVIFAAHMVGVQMEAISYLPAIAWGQSAATMIGQCLGAGKVKRAFQAGRGATLQCCLLGVAVTAAFFWGSELIYQTMHRDPQIGMVGVTPFRMVAIFQIPLMISLVLKFALHGAGDTRWPMIASISGTLLLRLPLSWLLGVYLGMGLMGAWIGMVADITYRAVVLIWRYLSCRWVHKKI